MQQGSGNSHLPSESFRQSNLTLMDVTPFHGAHAPYVQGSEQRTSQTMNLSLPIIVNQNLENSVDGPSAASTSSMIDLNAPYTAVNGGLPQDLGSTSAGNSSTGSLHLPGSASVLPSATASNAMSFHPSHITTIAHAPLSHVNTYPRRVEAHLDLIQGTNYFSNWSPSWSTIPQPAIIPRNYFSFWIPPPTLANVLAPVLPIMHAPSSFVPLPHSPWNWTYSSIQVPSMYPTYGTIGNEVILHRDSLPLVPTHQFPQISLVPGAERVITGVNMINSNFAVQQMNFPGIHTPRFMGDYFWHLPSLRGVNHAPGPMPLHPYNFNMAQNGGGMPQSFYVDIDNMSYEGLLAFQNRVGYVSTGLSKEVICARLKCSKYQLVEKSEDDNDMCIICLDDYCDGQIIGLSDCGHKFHFDCITEWLMQKNSCPFCRRTALTL